jgi:hypothetical protein
VTPKSSKCSDSCLSLKNLLNSPHTFFLDHILAEKKNP